MTQIGGDDTIFHARGTYEFLAPECCSTDSGPFSGKQADVWAVGVTIYALAFLELPFKGDGFQIIQSILEDE